MHSKNRCPLLRLHSGDNVILTSTRNSGIDRRRRRGGGNDMVGEEALIVGEEKWRCGVEVEVEVGEITVVLDWGFEEELSDIDVVLVLCPLHERVNLISERWEGKPAAENVYVELGFSFT
ncbi:hypothetical protein Droror1_Dr00021686 [Drosera rotundifolia]